MEKRSLSETLVILVVSIICSIATTFFSALVMMNLWNWFIYAGVGIGVERISYGVAYGICLIAHLVTLGLKTSKVENCASVIASALAKILVEASILGIAAIVATAAGCC